MISWQTLLEALSTRGQSEWAETLQSDSQRWLISHGDYARWQAALSTLPDIDVKQVVLDRNVVTVAGDCSNPELLKQSLKGLMPWRKGPYQLSDVFIDCEWRSDLKWQRVLPHLRSLRGHRVLDVGCGNGYHCWRMLAEQPDLVLGIEPSVLFNLQFRAINKYIETEKIHLLPIGIEAMPERLGWFDTVFSMGVLYHRKSPIDHLIQLHDLLKGGGQLCLETLVIEGEQGQVLVPGERYARMRNVWFIPSVLELCNWLTRCGFDQVEVVDESLTTIAEQRQTDWMQFESLEKCLDPRNPAKTVEGYPSPRRAVIIATAT